jgi:hypothetical protein
MVRKNKSDIQMLARVVEFYPSHGGLFKTNTVASETFAALGSALAKVSEEASRQLAGKNELKTNTILRAAAREELLSQLDRISNTAAAISIDKPGLELKFRLGDRSDQTLIQSARTFAAEAETMKSDFLQHCLPDNFIDNLRSGAAQLDRVILDQASSKNKRANATKALNEAMAECLTLLQRVDAIVANTLADNPPALAEWNVTRRVAYRSKRTPEGAPESPQAHSAAA